ncbi:MFS transporter [Actinophytocola sediminis]
MNSGSRRWWALGALSLVVLAVALPATILSVALPTLAPALDASAAELQWFVSAYTLVLAAGVLPGGLLGDRFGRKKVLLIALVVYAGGSVLAATATTPGMFITAQAVLGLGAAFVVPLVLSGLAVMFTPAERPRAIGIWAAANFLALPLGPIVGGWLLANFWWGWVFLMNLPIIVLALIAVSVLLPESRSERRPALDPVGIGMSSIGLGVLTFGVVEAGRNGWGSGAALGSMLGGVVILVAFARWERALDRRRPGATLVDLSLFTSARFTWGTIIAGLGTFAFFGLMFTAPQYFQAVLGTDAMGSGVRLLPLLGGMMVGAGLADRVAVRLGAKITVTAGFVIMSAALLLATATTATTGYGLAAAWTSIGGLGAGLALATASSAALATIDAERAGVASALNQAMQKLGSPLAAAILGSVLNSGYTARLDVTGLPGELADVVRDSVYAGVEVADRLGSPDLLLGVRSAFVDGLDRMLWVSLGVSVLGVLLTLLYLPARAPGSPSRPSTKQNRAMKPASEPSAEAARKAAGGLRERKKARTRAAIQEHAVRLFREQGFAATTIEQIAEVAEVSPSTVFRYFPTKEDLVTTDLVDPVIFAAFEAQPPELRLLDAWRNAMLESFASMTPSQLDTERGRGILTLGVPELWAASLPNITRGLDVMSELSARRLGREPDDPDVRHAVGALLGTLLVVALDWMKNPQAAIGPKVDDAITRLQAGVLL